MNNIDYVKKINTLGKVSRIILVIMRCLCMVAIIATIVGGIIIMTVLPKESRAITADGVTSFEIVVDESLMPEGVVSEISEDNEDVALELLGATLSFKDAVTENGSIKKYTMNADLNAPDSTLIVYGFAGICFGMALITAFGLIVVIFAGKLAKALETCESPFEEKVTRAMKHFGFSLIPTMALFITEQSINLTFILVVIAVIIFSYIFSYGAKLQQESDETL